VLDPFSSLALRAPSSRSGSPVGTARGEPDWGRASAPLNSTGGVGRSPLFKSGPVTSDPPRAGVSRRDLDSPAGAPASRSGSKLLTLIGKARLLPSWPSPRAPSSAALDRRERGPRSGP